MRAWHQTHKKKLFRVNVLEFKTGGKRHCRSAGLHVPPERMKIREIFDSSGILPQELIFGQPVDKVSTKILFMDQVPQQVCFTP